MPSTRYKPAVLCIIAGMALAALAQQSPAPILPPAKISADNPLGLTVDHATISVKDIDREESFLNGMFGFKEIDRGNFRPDVKFRSLAIPGVFRIDLVQHTGSARHSTPGAFDMEQGWVHIVFKSADIAAAYTKLVAKKANIRMTKNADGSFTEFFVIDPEGNEIELQR